MDEVPGKPGVYRSSHAKETSHATEDLVPEAVGALARLGEKDSRPSSSDELAKPAADLDPEAQIRKEIEDRYETLTTGILERISARTETPKEGPVLGASLGKGPTLRVVTIGEGLPAVNKAMPNALSSVGIYGEGWIHGADHGIIRETYSGATGKGVVVDIAFGIMEGTTFTPIKRGEQRKATLDDMERLKALFAEVEQAYSGTPAAEIQPGYTPLPYTPKAIGQA